MGQSNCFSTQNRQSFSQINKTNPLKQLTTTKLKILIDSSKNKYRVSTILFLRQNELSKTNAAGLLTLNSSGTHDLKTNITNSPNYKKNTLKIVTNLDNAFLIQNLDPQMNVWKFNKQWCLFKKDNVLFINNTQFKLTKLIKNREDFDDSNSPFRKYSSKKSEDQVLPCKICFDNTYDEKNVLMSPCKCTGSMGNVHIKCLAYWIFQNNQSEKDMFSADLKRQKCQICNSNYIQNKAFDQILDTVIFQKQSLQTPYAIFEGATYKENKIFKRILILSFKNKNLFKIEKQKIHQSNQLAQNTQNKISYCQIKYEQGEIYTKDNASSNGTGVPAQMPLRITNDKEECVMVDRDTLIYFSILNSKGDTVRNSLNSSVNQSSLNLMNN